MKKIIFLVLLLTTSIFASDTWYNLVLPNTVSQTTGGLNPPQTLQVGGTDGTNLRALSLDSSGKPQVNMSQVGGTSVSTGAGLTNAGTIRVVLPTDQSAIPVTGTVSATNPSVSTTGSAVPGSATFVGGSDGTNLRALKVSTAGVLSIDGSAVTQPISAASLPLPTGAATSAKQPALGTAGTASTDVISVQGIAGMTPFAVTGTFFQATQPVSGPLTDTQLRATPVPVTANAGTNLNTSALALSANQTNGTQKTQVVDGAGLVFGPALTFSGANYQPVFLAAGAINGAAIPTRSIQVSGKDGAGNAQPILVDTSGIQSVKPTDGTTAITVKAASTASVATDTSSVVALSPNSPVPAGVNTVGAVALVDGLKQSYSASSVGFVPAAAATDICTLTGSATKTIRLTRVEVTGTGTAAATVNISLIKRSTADTAGTAVAATVGPHDSNNAAGTATVNHYTANPTLGTTTFTARVSRYTAVAAAALINPLFWDFGERPAQAIVLRGTGQVAAINLGGATIAGPVFNCNWEYTEE